MTAYCCTPCPHAITCADLIDATWAHLDDVLEDR